MWQTARSMGWLGEGMGLVRVPLTPRLIPALEYALGGSRATTRRYSVGGNLLWLGWPEDTATEDSDQSSSGDLHSILLELDLQGVQLIGRARRAPTQHDGDDTVGGEGPLLGRLFQNAFLRRIALALDPEGKFEQY
ncbi:MAG: hypothetical protein F4148_08230 [Caldilineaceae bacterium SB0675_bin_29]|uniref:Uncharacterized protein n=1 Tax=Caldilineaceae bacterium SB0675_bin_29 TaxID=2605266 RepID=A0A6B1G0T1_9CHLR|nr:hypothetical protein [Caldilineaceae bacterium SB0675_bin_29]